MTLCSIIKGWLPTCQHISSPGQWTRHSSKQMNQIQKQSVVTGVCLLAQAHNIVQLIGIVPAFYAFQNVSSTWFQIYCVCALHVNNLSVCPQLPMSTFCHLAYVTVTQYTSVAASPPYKHPLARTSYDHPWCASGCVVECRICRGCRFESRPGLLRTKVYSAFHPSGLVNEYQLRLGRQRQVWLIPIADERVGVQVKLWNPLRTRAIPERFCGGDSLKRGAISIVCTFTFYLWHL